MAFMPDLKPPPIKWEIFRELIRALFRKQRQRAKFLLYKLFGRFPPFRKITFSNICSIYPSLTADGIVSIQPMLAPVTELWMKRGEYNA